MDKLPEAELAILEKNACFKFNASTLWRNLDALTDAVYTELERYDERARIIYSKPQAGK